MITSGLVGWWPLHERSGQANDLSGSAMTGTVNGATQGVASIRGITGYSFIVSDDVVSPYNGPANPDVLSISVWAKPDSNTEDLGYEAIVDNSRALGTGGGSVRGFAVGLRDRNIRATFGDGSNGTWLSAGPELNTENWFHIVYTFVSGQYILAYVNGQLYGVEPAPSVTGDFVVESDNILIAGDSASNGRAFSGDLSDVRIYNRALSPQEIQYIYEQGSLDVATPPEDGVARYAFDDLSTDDAIDSYGSNDGTNNGASYSNIAIRGLATTYESSSSDNINLGSNVIDLQNGDNMSVSGWIRLTDASANRPLISNWGGTNSQFLIYYSNGADEWQVFAVDGSGSSISATYGDPTTDSWYHLTAIYNATQSIIEFYLNGVSVASASWDGTWNDSSDDWLIGARNDGVYHDGEIDDVRIYDRVLSQSEVQQLYQWGTRGTDMRYELIQQ